MWPSEEVAVRLYNVANIGLVAGLILGVVSTVLVVWMGNVKEACLKSQLSATDSISSQANARSKDLEKSNLKLRADLATQLGEVAGLQADASDAKASQQKVEIDLEKQKEKTAEAEDRLLELAKKQAPRFVQKSALSSLLEGKATGTVTILYQPNDPEAYWFAFSLMSEISSSGWKVPSLPASITSDIQPRAPGFTDEDMQRIAAFEQRFPASMRAGVGSGLTILAHSIQEDQALNGSYKVLTNALTSLKLLNGRRVDINLPLDNFILVVGPKP